MLQIVFFGVFGKLSLRMGAMGFGSMMFGLVDGAKVLEY
jgi:hypothetical protein